MDDTVARQRITVWYADEEDAGGPSRPWIGDVLRLCIRDGMQVRFDDWPDDHPDKIMWVSRTEDDWAWGEHSRRPSRKAQQIFNTDCARGPHC